MKTLKSKIIPTSGHICLLALACSSGAVALAQPYAIEASSIAGGSGTSTNGVYAVSGTIGQPIVGMMAGGSYSLQGGFWAVVQTPGAPRLNIERLANGVRLFWPLSDENFLVEETPSLGGPSPAVWSEVTTAYQTNAAHISVTLPILPGNKFFRLRKQP